jgi:hypothetical protein
VYVVVGQMFNLRIWIGVAKILRVPKGIFKDGKLGC